MGKTIVIIGAGTSLMEIPPNHVFTNDTMALNVSTIAPQFFDYKTESFHHSWTYGVFIDKMIASNFYFPERLYYSKSIANHAGILYLGDRLITPDLLKLPNVRSIPVKKGQKMVLVPSIIEAKRLGYEHVILVGCDFMLYDARRYWWEYPEYEPGILMHPNGKGVVNATGLSLIKIKKVSTQVDADDVRTIAYDKYEHHYKDRHGDERVYVPVCDTRDGTGLMSSLLYKQYNIFKSVMGGLVDSTFKVSKYTGMGMLDVPVVDNLNEL